MSNADLTQIHYQNLIQIVSNADLITNKVTSADLTQISVKDSIQINAYLIQISVKRRFNTN